jgi:hypothetical protein
MEMYSEEHGNVQMKKDGNTSCSKAKASRLAMQNHMNQSVCSDTAMHCGTHLSLRASDYSGQNQVRYCTMALWLRVRCRHFSIVAKG